MCCCLIAASRVSLGKGEAKRCFRAFHHDFSGALVKSKRCAGCVDLYRVGAFGDLGFDLSAFPQNLVSVHQAFTEFSVVRNSQSENSLFDAADFVVRRIKFDFEHSNKRRLSALLN